MAYKYKLMDEFEIPGKYQLRLYDPITKEYIETVIIDVFYIYENLDNTTEPWGLGCDDWESNDRSYSCSPYALFDQNIVYGRLVKNKKK